MQELYRSVREAAREPKVPGTLSRSDSRLAFSVLLLCFARYAWPSWMLAHWYFA